MALRFSFVFLALIVLSAPAHAAIFLTDASGLEFEINTDTSAVSSTASGAANDATYTTSVTVSTTGGGTTLATEIDDAFDDYNAVSIGGVTYTDNGVGTLIDGGRTVLLNPQTIGDLLVHREVFVPADDEFCRWLTFIENTGGSTVDATVAMLNNLGSDGSTTIHTTSSGDATVTTDDNWIVSFEDGSPFYEDPRLGHVLQSDGAVAPVTFIDFSDGENTPDWEYEVSIAPGERQIIMNLVTGQPNLPDTVSQSAILTVGGGSALDFLAQDEIDDIVNFVFGATPVADADPRTTDVCFVATAAYGTPMASDIDALRSFRDGYLLTSPLGTLFVDGYYRTSPPIADFVAQHPAAATMVRVALTPVVFVLSTPWTAMAIVLFLVGAFVARRQVRVARIRVK